MKIFLCCAAGMSTSMLVDKMKKVAIEKGINDIQIEAFSVSEFSTQVEINDICLVAPQARYRFDEFNAVCSKLGKPCALIPMMDYGTMNGSAVLELALNAKAETVAE